MGYNVGLKTTTFGGETSILDSEQVRYVRGGVTLEAAQVSADGNGIKKLPAGTFLGVSGGKWRKYAAGTAAFLVTGVVGNNNAIRFTAETAGTVGHGIKVALLDPSGNSKPLEVTIVNDEIRVSLATSGAGAITSTAAQVIAAVNSHLVAKTLVSTANEGASTGAGVVVAAAAAALANGVDANVTPTLMLAEEVLFTSFSASGGVSHADQVATAFDWARVITSRLPAAPDAVVRANMPGITFA